MANKTNLTIEVPGRAETSGSKDNGDGSQGSGSRSRSPSKSSSIADQSMWTKAVAYDMQYMNGVMKDSQAAAQTVALVQEAFVFLVAAPIPPYLNVVYTPGFYTNGFCSSDSYAGKFMYLTGDPVLSTSTMLHPLQGDGSHLFVNGTYVLTPEEDWDGTHKDLLDSDAEWQLTKATPICPIPLHWTHEWLGSDLTAKALMDFMEFMTPEYAKEDDKKEFDTIKTWLRVASVQKVLATDESQLQISWATPPLSKGRQDRIHKTVASKWPEITASPGHGNSGPSPKTLMEQAMKLADWSMHKQSQKEAAEKDNKDPFLGAAKFWMIGWCGIDMNKKDDIPPIWKRFITEKDTGRQNILAEEIKKSCGSSKRIAIRITAQLLKDLTKLTFGYENDSTVELAGYGITPYAVPFNTRKENA